MSTNHSRVKDLTGSVFGKLTVDNLAGVKNGRSYWNCTCECGNRVQVASNNLRKSKENRCGKCHSRPLSEALSMIIMRDYRHRAQNKNLSFKLSKQYFMDLLQEPCYYCGMEKSNLKTRGNRTYRYNGIDRLNSGNGYVPGNVVSSCKNCNLMKKDMTVLEFKNHIVKIFGHWVGR